MGNHVKRQNPDAMPSDAQITEYNQKLPKELLVFGCRGESKRANSQPNPQIHTGYTSVNADILSLDTRRVVIFIHGYNVTKTAALSGAGEFYTRLYHSLLRDGQDTSEYQFVLFTWPGDVGTVYFDDAQVYAQLSGVALFKWISDLYSTVQPKSLAIVTHSLGAHVALKGSSILGERLFRKKLTNRINTLLLLGAAVEDDVFSRPERHEEYHFPESAFALEHLHIVISRNDNVLGRGFRINEYDKALGFAGPETMSTLTSLARRVKEVLGTSKSFFFEQHDFSLNSNTIYNPELLVRSHNQYWHVRAQTDYYLKLLT